MKLLLLLSIIILTVFGLSPEPVPTCNVPHVSLKEYPISLNQIISFNANDIFKGYNLNYSLVGAPSFVYMRQKFKLYKSQNTTQPGFKNYHLDHQLNHWGKKLVTISQWGNTTIIRWGISQTIDSIPLLTEKVQLINDPKTQCFDAIWLRASGLILVDCVRQSTFGVKNVFLYINTTTQKTLTKEVPNDMYVGFTQITKRKIVHYTEDGQQYLIRSYFADSVDPQHSHNTYLQIFLINDPFRPRTIKVMDRSYLHQDRLSIMDFKVYLGDMYILDYHSGVTCFDITPSQNIIIKGRYRTDSGYHAMAVYTNNLDKQTLLALANDHGIYQVDWSNQLKPIIIAKYSIMQGSKVNSLWVNQEYIAAQITANITTSDNKTYQSDSSYIFDRGTRTYTNAYAVIPHASPQVVIDMNLQHNYLVSIDQVSIDTYQIDEPIIFMYPTNPSDNQKQFQFTIKAMSRNEINGHSLVCSFDIKIHTVPVDSMGLFPSGFDFPNSYYSNYPGQLFIPLNRYVYGANLTYGVQQKVLNQSVPLPTYWILQQNDTIIHWDKQPSLMKITFLRKQQFQLYNEQYFFIYTQDSANKTHITRCKTIMLQKDVNCSDNSQYLHLNHKINNLTATVFQPVYGQMLHLVGLVFDSMDNQVFIYNINRQYHMFKPIIMGQGYQGKIQSIQFLGHYLAVVLRYMKQIVFYDMKQCNDHPDNQCRQIYRVDSIMMDKLGIKYFSPLDIYTSDFHPFVLFIQNVDSVIMLDITSQGPILLDQIMSPATKQPGFWKWKMAITHGHLVLINPPNIIEQYSLMQLYTRKSTHMTKSYPLYNYTIPDNFDCDFSDHGDLLYITAIDKNLPAQHNSVILVYRSDQPAVATFYDVFHINGKYDDMLIDVTGTWADYVSVAMGSRLMMFRQYQQPILVFSNTFTDFKFNITYTNDPQHQYHYLASSQVFVANYPEGITINDSKLNQSDYLTNQVKYENKYQEFVLDDSTWFKGSVLNYTLEDCQQCGNKFKVINHVQDKRDFFSQTDMEDYVYTSAGGVIQQFQSLIQMKHNGSIDQITTFPSVLDGQHCQHIQHSWVYDYTLSACQSGSQWYLYTTTYTSFKPFVNGPFYSGAQNVTGIHIMEDIMILVDVDPNPWHMNRQGGILIYAMNHNPFDPEMFDEIQYLDTQDLESAVNWPGGKAHIGNAQLVFTNETQTYRIALTELRHGMFFVDFKWSRGRRSIEITKIQFVDLNKLLIQKNFHMPNLAFFQAIAITQTYYDKIFNYMQVQCIVTTRNFHMFQFNFHFDKTGTIVDRVLSKVHYRYGFYETSNYIRHFDGYFAVTQQLPTSFQYIDWYSKQVMTVYDTKQRWVFNSTQKVPVTYHQGTNIPINYMLGGMVFPKGKVGFDFNFTFKRNSTDPFRDIGLLAVHARYSIIRQIAIHDHLTIITEDGISGNQDAKLKANNDFASVSIPISIIAGGLGAGAIIAIVIGCILIAVGGGYLVYKWNLKRKANIKKELEESLIDRDTLVTHQNQQEENQEQGQSDQQQGEQDQQEEEQEQEQEKTQQVTAQIQNVKIVQNTQQVTVQQTQGKVQQ